MSGRGNSPLLAGGGGPGRPGGPDPRQPRWNPDGRQSLRGGRCDRLEVTDGPDMDRERSPPERSSPRHEASTAESRRGGAATIAIRIRQKAHERCARCARRAGARSQQLHHSSAETRHVSDETRHSPRTHLC